jgi:hypothetical protein
MNIIQFAHPEDIFTLLWLIPLIAGICAFARYRERQARTAYGNEANLERFSQSTGWGESNRALIEFVLLALMIVLSLADPVIPNRRQEVTAGSVDVVAVIDSSPSMAAPDYRNALPLPLAKSSVCGFRGAKASGAGQMDKPVTRFDMVRQIVLRQLLPNLSCNRFGIVTFARKGFSFIELSQDPVDSLASKFMVDKFLKIDNPPGGRGSNLALGLLEGLEMFDRNAGDGKEKVMVLFSDGGYDSDEALLLQTFEAIKKSGVHLIIVAVGSTSPSPIEIHDERGEARVLMSRLDESLLFDKLHKQIPGSTYVRLGLDGRLNVSWGEYLNGGTAHLQGTKLFQVPLFFAIAILCLRGVRSLRPLRHRFRGVK